MQKIRLQLTHTLLLAVALIGILAASSSLAFADSYASNNTGGDMSQGHWYSAGTNGTSTSNPWANTSTNVYGATLTPSQEVPSVTGTSTSSTTGMIRLQPGSSSTAPDTISYTLTVLNGMDIIGAHLHCAPIGMNGPVVVPLFGASASSSVDINGTLISGTITASDMATSTGCISTIGRSISSVADLKQAIMAGMIYANVHSVQYPAGVARGQLSATRATMPGSGNGVYSSSTNSGHEWDWNKSNNNHGSWVNGSTTWNFDHETEDSWNTDHRDSYRCNDSGDSYTNVSSSNWHDDSGRWDNDDSSDNRDW